MPRVAYRIMRMDRQAIMARRADLDEDRRIKKQEKTQIDDLKDVQKAVVESQMGDGDNQVFAMVADAKLTPDLTPPAEWTA